MLVRKQKSRGAILIVSLIMLAIIAAIGISILSVSVLEQKMAQNQQDKFLAQQAADFAVAQAKQYIINQGNPWSFAQGLCNGGACSTVWSNQGFLNALGSNGVTQQSASWWAANGRQTETSPNPTAKSQNPYFIIVFWDCDKADNMPVYRIIGRGTGLMPNTVAFTDVIYATVNVGYEKQPAPQTYIEWRENNVSYLPQQGLYLPPSSVSNPFYNWGTGTCPQGSAPMAWCETNCMGMVRVVGYGVSSGCIPIFGPWISASGSSQIKVDDIIVFCKR